MSRGDSDGRVRGLRKKENYGGGEYLEKDWRHEWVMTTAGYSEDAVGQVTAAATTRAS